MVIFVNYVRNYLFIYLSIFNSLFLIYIEYRTVKLPLNTTYTPDYQNLSSNASQQLEALINNTLNTAFINITNGGVSPDLISIV